MRETYPMFRTCLGSGVWLSVIKNHPDKKREENKDRIDIFVSAPEHNVISNEEVFTNSLEEVFSKIEKCVSLVKEWVYINTLFKLKGLVVEGTTRSKLESVLNSAIKYNKLKGISEYSADLKKYLSSVVLK